MTLQNLNIIQILEQLKMPQVPTLTCYYEALDVQQFNKHEVIINDFHKLIIVLINSVKEKKVLVKFQI